MDEYDEPVFDNKGNKIKLSDIIERYQPDDSIDFRFPRPVRAFEIPANYLVLGAGAISNHTLKNLTPLIRGHVTIVDFDAIELTNIFRCELFWDSYSGRKAETLEKKVRKLNPDLDVRAIYGKIGKKESLTIAYANSSPAIIDIEDLAGLNPDIFIAGLDNPEARLLLNRAAIQLRRPYIDGGSSASGAQIIPYLPGRTGCLDCSCGIEVIADAAREKSKQNAGRCQTGAPSVDSANRVAGGLQAYLVLQSLQHPGQITGFDHQAFGHDGPICSIELHQYEDCPCSMKTAE